MSEFDWIAWLKTKAQHLGAGRGVVLGMGDDAALCTVPAGMELAVCTDTLVAGVHFPPETAAADIGYKALAVNLSDMAAMGADPVWMTLALTVPEMDWVWLQAFSEGLLELAQDHGLALIGGDTTCGPLCVTVTLHGFVPAGSALRRNGARVGDDVWVTGSLGDAAAALQQYKHGPMQSMKLRHRLDRPTPRVAAGRALRGLASAAIDISDGLAQDLAHVLNASGVGAELELGRLPVSASLLDFHKDDATRWRLQLSGGDDYELCFTAAPADALAIEQALAAAEVRASVIGHIREAAGLHCLMPNGEPLALISPGYQHFAAGSDVH